MEKRHNYAAAGFLLLGIGAAGRAFLGVPEGVTMAELSLTVLLVIGALLYPTLVRGWLMKKDAQGHRLYVNRWPAWLDLEDAAYRPLLRLLGKLGMGIARILDRSLDQMLFH